MCVYVSFHSLPSSIKFYNVFAVCSIIKTRKFEEIKNWKEWWKKKEAKIKNGIEANRKTRKRENKTQTNEETEEIRKGFAEHNVYFMHATVTDPN